jgi:hypothetical protein
MRNRKRVIIDSTRMTVTRNCTFFQRRQRSTNPVGEVGAHRGGRRFSDAADFRSEPVPTKIPGPADERHLKLLGSPTQAPRIQDTPSHIHNGFKTCYPRSPPNRQAIGCCSCPEAHLCLCSSSWRHSCPQGRCYLQLPADPWCQDN